MKLILIAALISTSAAFAPAPIARHSAALRSASSDAIEAAMAASKEHGAASKEASVLWDIVEEIDSADNSAAFKPVIADAEYEEKVKALSQMLTKTRDELDTVKQLADDLKGVKLATPPLGAKGEPSEAMKAALAEARSASEEFGKSSPEAALAWETVEEIAAARNDNVASQATLDEECLIDLIEGCEALEKFKDALDGR
mmetsp:Transcript_14779/g.32116  ORF Transcript_14779/g.32116 Transcript_14779/m.32116 type:complete len:200 (+) Transcript_14779:75-674(+)|eukprot:CAMPEP_0172304322 /NCGR_PEP_ID=MMETSP1058-20130122/5741_1 /TAXON_ID=83371 /ORGANISM="Detonula confervacea, Strain CCMP 353" /LENGTH=199 /DNA_ID=CAMNT_0013015501 /DNA_START=79 /DNA_END=678 /DNA_ORIENTATION=+